MISRGQYVMGVLSGMLLGALLGNAINFPPREGKRPSQVECYGQGYFDGMNYAMNRELKFEASQTNRLLQKAGMDTVIWNPVPYDSASPELQAIRDRSGLFR